MFLAWPQGLFPVKAAFIERGFLEQKDRWQHYPRQANSPRANPTWLEIPYRMGMQNSKSNAIACDP
jgi:hypothetical protein